ncbi:hypothetical protein CVIRNUC_004045 [Coccomyxa viridis]|uniref:Uncharacterized protein n=1 Tax=Coccomyxa viridis TaxID=1274662 RepID=A0AAV1I3B0_9CHLO|nr:hypothetical protein CVIRNUC_004045 [Coccomyxa viridis]
MSLHERVATLRSPGHQRQGSGGERGEEAGWHAMHRAGSGVMGATDGSELHERSTRSNGTSPSPAELPLSSPHDADGLATKGEGAYKYQIDPGSPRRAPKTLEVKSGGSRAASLVGFLKSREGQLGILSMVMLIFQGTALSLTLRFSRTRAGTQYLASVAVIWTELIKLLVCVGAQAAECTRTAAQRGLGFREEAMHQAYEILGRSWPMLIPAGLFVMQQVLVIVAASHLDAVTFQICSQSFKIMPTAFFAVWLLGQYLTPLQWGSLPVLAVGVVFVTMNGSTPAGGGSMDGESDLVLGLAASALSGLSSAYAGVYFEKYVKGKLGQTLWIRNLQLSIYGVLLSLAYTYLRDGRTVAAGGLMQGFDYLAWSVVGLQVFGGLIVGMVVKYADNILKNFANALSVIFTVIGAVPLFHQYPSGWFILGVAFVILSVCMYGKSTPPGYETFESCFKSCTGRSILPYSTSDDAGTLMQWLSPLRRRGESLTKERWSMRGSATRIILIAASILALILMIAATHHPRTQEVMQRGADHLGKMINKGLDRHPLPATGLKAGLPGGSEDTDLRSSAPLMGLQGQSLDTEPSLFSSKDLAMQQAMHDDTVARQWLPHSEADNNEMNNL